MIELKQISKIYGQQTEQALALLQDHCQQDEIRRQTGCTVALRQVNLTIEEGDIFCILGSSGSGKSTLLRHINRLIEPTLGEVWFHDVNVTQLKKQALNQFRQTHIAMVFQHFGLFPHLKAIDNVAYGLRVMGVGKKERHETALHYLHEVGLDGYADYYPDQFSGGMKQRIGLARALAVDTPVLLMDEPFSALDPITRLKLQELLLELQRKLNKTIVFITHDVQEAKKISNQVALLHQGEVLQTGTLQSLIDHPQHPYVAEFMHLWNLS